MFSMVIKYSFKEEDIPTSGAGQLLPTLFGKSGGMKRFAVAEDERLRAGFTKIVKGGGFKSYFWYDETWFIIDGEMEVVTVTRAEEKTEKFTLKPRDAFYIPAGTHITTTVSKEKVVFMYVAVPASIKDARWLAYMTPEDLQDVKSRKEFKQKDAWTAGRAGDSDSTK